MGTHCVDVGVGVIPGWPVVWSHCVYVGVGVIPGWPVVWSHCVDVGNGVIAGECDTVSVLPKLA